MMYFQQYVERKAFVAGGGKFVAPAQRLVDFTNTKVSSSLPDCSYLPGLHSVQFERGITGFYSYKPATGFYRIWKKNEEAILPMKL